MKKTKITVISLILTAALLLCGCGSKKKVIKQTEGTSGNTDNTDKTVQTNAQVTEAKQSADLKSSDYEYYFRTSSHEVTLDTKYFQSNNPWVIFKLENGGFISILLYPEYCNNAVNNFIERVLNGEYDGFSFMSFDSRLGMRAVGTDADYTLETEKLGNFWTKRSKNIVFMEKDEVTGNTSGSRFFIPLGEEYQSDYVNELYKEYIAVGMVILGREYLYEAALEAEGQTVNFSMPLAIEKAIIDLKGYEPADVIKITAAK